MRSELIEVPSRALAVALLGASAACALTGGALRLLAARTLARGG